MTYPVPISYIHHFARKIQALFWQLKLKLERITKSFTIEPSDSNTFIKFCFCIYMNIE